MTSSRFDTASRRGEATRAGAAETTGAAGRGAVAVAMRRLLSVVGADAEAREIDVGGTRVHFLDAGAGPAVVLVHGASGGGANWYGVLGRLAAGYRVLAPDLPGFGLSAPIETRAPLGCQVADLLAGWLDAVGVERCHLGGTSFGGLVALRMAQRVPDRVRRLALIDAAGLGREVPFVARLVGVPPFGRLLLRSTRWGTRWQLRNVLTAGRPLAADIEAALADYLWRSAAVADVPGLARAYRRFCGLRGQREVLADDELRAVNQPTLVVWGDEDRFFPPTHAERAAALIPDARLLRVPGAGHSPNWEAPGVVADALATFFDADTGPP